MEYVAHSFRHAEAILSQPNFRPLMEELSAAIHSITDEDLIESFHSTPHAAKSISRDINNVLKNRLEGSGWASESPIFQNDEYDDKRWRLDFAKERISVEVAFNHGEAIAWNLIKPVLASELNHVQKAIQTEIGVIICATADLKVAGGFDNAVGEYEKFLRYLIPLQDLLTVPLLIIGLKAPRTFKVTGTRINGRTVGAIELIHGDSE
jgi:hypothetical protein